MCSCLLQQGNKRYLRKAERSGSGFLLQSAEGETTLAVSHWQNSALQCFNSFRTVRYLCRTSDNGNAKINVPCNKQNWTKPTLQKECVAAITTDVFVGISLYLQYTVNVLRYWSFIWTYDVYATKSKLQWHEHFTFKQRPSRVLLVKCVRCECDYKFTSLCLCMSEKKSGETSGDGNYFAGYDH